MLAGLDRDAVLQEDVGGAKDVIAVAKAGFRETAKFGDVRSQQVQMADPPPQSLRAGGTTDDIADAGKGMPFQLQRGMFVVAPCPKTTAARPLIRQFQAICANWCSSNRYNCEAQSAFSPGLWPQAWAVE